MSPVAEKSLRRDAVRNRERLVASARRLFASRGIDVSVEEITHHAGVGMGTLYRHFPTKDELIDAVLEDSFAEMIRVAEAAAADEDAWRGFTTLVEQLLEMHAHHRGVKDLIATRQHGAERLDKMRARMRPLLRRVVERAQEQGALRADFTPEDFPLVLWSTTGVIEVTEEAAPGYWRRYVALLLDGLRAVDPTPLPAPPLTRAQLTRIRRGRSK